MSKNNMSIIGEIHKEMDRCRKLYIEYQSIGEAGVFGMAIIMKGIKHAEKAIEENDVVEMIAAYKNLQSITG